MSSEIQQYPKGYNWIGGLKDGVAGPLTGALISKGFEFCGIPIDQNFRLFLMITCTVSFGVFEVLLSEAEIFVKNIKTNGLKR